MDGPSSVTVSEARVIYVMRSAGSRQFSRIDESSSREAFVLDDSGGGGEEDSVPVDTNVDLLPDRPEGTHVLMRSRFMLAAFAFVQTVFGLSAVFVLSDASVRTGWAHTFGLFCAVLCATEGALHVVLRSLGKLTAVIDAVSFVACALCFGGLAGLVTNTEDDAHGVAVDGIETAVCLFVLAWGHMAARLSASVVEREAMRECTFEVKFHS